MSKVKVVEANSIAWQLVADAVAPDVAARISRAERDADVRIMHSNADGLQLFEARIAPDEEIALHAHAADEIIYILEGELLIGRKRMGPGASVFVAGDTLYGFRSGATGVRFLNFRGRSNTSFITRGEYLAAHGSRRSPGQSRPVLRSRAWRRTASSKAVKRFTESGLSAARYSGCHCTPSAKLRAPRTETASMTPSSARASTVRPSASHAMRLADGSFIRFMCLVTKS